MSFYFLFMNQDKIRLCYRKVIDASSAKAWEKFVFEDSYNEFLLQAQFYNQEKRFATFGELLHHVPGADHLHFLVSAAVVGYVQQLEGRIPDITNALGKQFLSFTHYRFEIINSDLKNKSKHQVAVNFFSEPLTWLATIGSQLLVSANKTSEEGETLTDLFSMQPFLSIFSIV